MAYSLKEALIRTKMHINLSEFNHLAPYLILEYSGRG